MIDYILAFADEAEAQADAITGKYYSEGWRGDCTIANVSCYRQASLFNDDWRVLIAVEPNDDLLNHPNLELAYDRAAKKVVKFTLGKATDFRYEPLFS